MHDIKSVNEIPATVQTAETANLSLTTAELDNRSSDYFVNIGLKKFASQIYPNELSADFANESVSECLNRLKIRFGNITPDQKEGLAEIIGRSFCSTEKLLRIATAITMPSQLILGLMLTRLKELTQHGEFTDLAAKHFPDLSKKTMNNYMNAARILDFAGFEKYLTCGLNVLSKLGMLLSKKVIVGDDLFAAIAQAFKVISKDREPDDEDYLRVAEYVSILKADFAGYPRIDLEKFHELYKSEFSFSTRDLAFIKRNSKENPTFVNEFMSKLLENNLNRNELGGYFQKNEPVNVTRPEKNVEHFSVSLAKIVQVAKSFAENHTKICDADYQNLQELKLHIETLEKKYKQD